MASPSGCLFNAWPWPATRLFDTTCDCIDAPVSLPWANARFTRRLTRHKAWHFYYTVPKFWCEYSLERSLFCIPTISRCRNCMELTRFRGHLNVRFGGVHDGREDGPVHTGV